MKNTDTTQWFDQHATRFRYTSDDPSRVGSEASRNWRIRSSERDVPDNPNALTVVQFMSRWCDMVPLEAKLRSWGWFGEESDIIAWDYFTPQIETETIVPNPDAALHDLYKDCFMQEARKIAKDHESDDAATGKKFLKLCAKFGFTGSKEEETP